MGLIDSSNKVVVRYQYNSCGKVTSSEDTSGVSLATLNPFCYRKYVYDPETGLYCLGSRYYDPEVGRFVNADSIKFVAILGRYYVNRQNLYQLINNKFNHDKKISWYFYFFVRCCIVLNSENSFFRFGLVCTVLNFQFYQFTNNTK